MNKPAIDGALLAAMRKAVDIMPADTNNVDTNRYLLFAGYSHADDNLGGWDHYITAFDTKPDTGTILTKLSECLEFGLPNAWWHIVDLEQSKIVAKDYIRYEHARN